MYKPAKDMFFFCCKVLLNQFRKGHPCKKTPIDQVVAGATAALGSSVPGSISVWPVLFGLVLGGQTTHLPGNAPHTFRGSALLLLGNLLKSQESPSKGYSAGEGDLFQQDLGPWVQICVKGLKVP